MSNVIPLPVSRRSAPALPAPQSDLPDMEQALERLRACAQSMRADNNRALEIELLAQSALREAGGEIEAADRRTRAMDARLRLAERRAEAAERRIAEAEHWLDHVRSALEQLAAK